MRDGDLRHFDRWAARYDRSLTQPLFFRRVHERALKVVAGLSLQPQRILDVGCGTGALLRLLSRRFPDAELVGVDGSSEMIRMANRSNPEEARLRFMRGLVEELPFESRRFDLVVSTVSFHHWADQRLGLREVNRVLKPDGAFFLADHFVTPSLKIFFLGEGRRERHRSHGEVDAMLVEAGFGGLKWHDLYKIGPLRIATGCLSTFAHACCCQASTTRRIQ